MNFDLNKAYIIRKSQDAETVSFRVCFGHEKDWFGMDFTLKKAEFKELSQLEPANSIQMTVDEVTDNLRKNLFRNNPRFIR